MTTLAPSLRYTQPVDGPSAVVGRDRAGHHVVLAWVICLFVHVFLVSAGLLFSWPQYTARYDLLSRAFLHGQTSLLIPADPRHLALPDPYDPAANALYRQTPGVPDSCLYNGKFYVYWGPVPSLLLMPIRAIVGEDVRIGDQFVTFFFVQGLLLIVGRMLLRLRREFFPNSPARLPAVAVFVLGLSAPIGCAMTRAAVYEAAIVGGQFFLLSGIYLAWSTLATRTMTNVRLGVAGLCLALAVGCRVSLAIAVTGIAIIVTLQLAGRFWRQRPPIASLAAFVSPLILGATALGYYNQIRFDHWWEFGQKYQLAATNLKSYPSLFGVANLWPGLWSYFLRPVAVVPRFPFLLPISGDGTFPSFIRLPEHYESFDAITGIIWVMPFLWFMPLAMLPRTTGGSKNHLGLLIMLLVLAAVLAFAPVLLMIGSSQRYLVDFTPSLIVVAMIGVWKLAGRPKTTPAWRKRWIAIAGSLAAVTILFGLLLSIEGYSGHFRTYNQTLFQSLSSAVTGPAPALQPEAQKLHS